MNDRLYRSATNRVFSGLCGGMADHFDLDPALVRLGWVVLDVLTGIFPLLVVLHRHGDRRARGAPGGRAGPVAGLERTAVGPRSRCPAGCRQPNPGAARAPARGSRPQMRPTRPRSRTPEARTAARTRAVARGGPGDLPRRSARTGARSGPTPRAQRRAEHAYWRSQRRGGDGSTAGLVIGVILVAIGGLFLLRQTVPGFDTALFWPVVLIVLGALLLGGAFRR